MLIKGDRWREGVKGGGRGVSPRRHAEMLSSSTVTDEKNDMACTAVVTESNCVEGGGLYRRKGVRTRLPVGRYRSGDGVELVEGGLYRRKGVRKRVTCRYAFYCSGDGIELGWEGVGVYSTDTGGHRTR